MRDGDLRKLFKKHIPKFHWQPIETGAMGSGIPDTNWCFEGQEGWVEYKWSDRGLITLRPEQVGWIIERTRHGGNVKIAVRWTQYGEEYIGIFDGHMCEDFTRRSVIDNLEYMIYSSAGKPNIWVWNKIQEALLDRTYMV